jgi:hypothetical protein
LIQYTKKHEKYLLTTLHHPEIFRGPESKRIGKNYSFGSVESGMNGRSPEQYTKDSCLKASPRHGGQEFFFKIVIDPVLGCLFGDGGIYCQINSGVTISASYLNIAIFIGNAQKTRKTTDFSPRNLRSPNAKPPKQVIRHHRVKRRGGSVGQARSSPSSYNDAVS